MTKKEVLDALSVLLEQPCITFYAARHSKASEGVSEVAHVSVKLGVTGLYSMDVIFVKKR